MIHRWSGGPEDDWRPWLKNELEKLGFEVAVPEMPDTDEPSISKWVGHLSHVVGKPDGEIYFVGHSIGCQTILRYLAHSEVPVGGAVFVAGWFYLQNLGDEEAEEIAGPWLKEPIDLGRVKNVLPASTLIIGDNGPFNAYEQNVQKFRELGSNIVTLPGGGHITEEDGYTTLPEALDELKRMAGVR